MAHREGTWRTGRTQDSRAEEIDSERGGQWGREEGKEEIEEGREVLDNPSVQEPSSTGHEVAVGREEGQDIWVRRRIHGKRKATEQEEQAWSRSSKREEHEGEQARGRGTAEEQKRTGRRKRLVGKQPPPQHTQQVTGAVKCKDKKWARGHVLQRRGQAVFCINCGKFATRHMGIGLRGACRAQTLGAQAAKRVQRLLQGLHPVRDTFIH